MKIEDTVRFQAKKLHVAFYRVVDGLGFRNNRYFGGIIVRLVFAIWMAYLIKICLIMFGVWEKL
ncbi:MULTISPECIES: hypothetical protein [Sphingobacterium]|uniref:hypothetical protein n=1 Tax=Sphingobacterium TaxID=28453 RepID=UPI00257B8BE3|nr:MULTISPECIES: hypothetical protein [Sphingobacterium]